MNGGAAGRDDEGKGERVTGNTRVVRRRGVGSRRKNEALRRAVHRNRLLSRNGIAERLFTWAFKGLVYPQIWEDPALDLDALEIGPDHHLVTIASGGCNVLSYLQADPARITAVDLNRAHVALTRLKLVGARRLPDYDAFFAFFGRADDPGNVRLYDRHIKRHLDPAARSYWERRDWRRRRRVGLFARNIYRHGLLGKFIGASHLVARLYGRNPRTILQARTLEEQRSIFDEVIAPLFDRRLVQWIVNRPVALYGLGIPPAQYEALGAYGGRDMASVLRERLERLACDFSLSDNYFAHQAFGRRYPQADAGPLPPYLHAANHAVLRTRVDRVDVQQISFTRFLQDQPEDSVDRYVLLDAQDWMTEQDLTALWREITRTARAGARVIFRTAAEPSLLPGRVPEAILAQWDYCEDQSKALGQRDRSSIYGGFHLYVLKPDRP